MTEEQKRKEAEDKRRREAQRSSDTSYPTTYDYGSYDSGCGNSSSSDSGGSCGSD